LLLFTLPKRVTSPRRLRDLFGYYTVACFSHACARWSFSCARQSKKRARRVADERRWKVTRCGVWRGIGENSSAKNRKIAARKREARLSRSSRSVGAESETRQRIFACRRASFSSTCLRSFALAARKAARRRRQSCCLIAANLYFKSNYRAAPRKERGRSRETRQINSPGRRPRAAEIYQNSRLQ